MVSTSPVETSIDKGTYGTVHKTKINGELVAIKRIPLDLYSKSFQNETFIGFQMSNLKHVVQFRKSFIEGESGCIVMDLCKTNLLQICKKLNTNLSEKLVASIFYQICLAVKELHEIGIAHLDLKLENILLTEENRIKLCDFGCSANFNDLEQKIRITHKIGTPIYLAPEIESTNFLPTKADIWSLGIILHLLLAQCFPIKTTCATSYVDPYNFTLSHCRYRSKKCRNLVKSLLDFKAKKRPSIQDVLRHPWMKVHTKLHSNNL